MARKETFKSKNQLVNKILKYVDKIDGEAIIDEENKTISAKFNGTIKGSYMANDGFTPKQLEQLGLVVELVVDAKIKPIREDIKEIKDRLDVVEKDIKAIKSCPTIQKEIKED